MNQNTLYRVRSASHWLEAHRSRRIRRSRMDRQTGRIHLTMRDAVETVAARHFEPEEWLLAVALDTRPFAEDIEWLAPSDEHPWHCPMLNRTHLLLDWVTGVYPLHVSGREDERVYTLADEALVWAL